jgi:hypothetical protein
MVAQMVQDRTFKDFENVVRHRDKIEEELEDMRQLLRQIREAQATDNNIEMGPSASQTRGELESSEWDTIKMIPQSSSMFHVTPSIVRMDEIMG